MRKKVKDQKVKKSKVKKDKNRKKEKKQKPLSIFGLLVTIIKGIFKSIPKMWKSILIRSAISFFVVTAFSMYSIAVKNEGTGAVRFASGTFWGDAINTGGNEAAFNTMCFIATYALTMIVSRIRNGGVKKFFKDIFGTIPWTKECLVGSKTLVGPLMFFTMALIMSLGIFVNNNLLFITLGITLFFEYASREKGLVSVLSLAFWNDFHRVFKRKKGIQPLNFKYVGMITLSMLLGMIILIFMPVDRARTFSIILTILFIALGALLTYNKISKKVAKNTVSFVIFALLSYQLTGIVFADNGGWTEGGRSVTTYVGSAGSVGAFITSAVSGIFSVAGGLLGVAIGGMSGSIDIKGNWNYGSEMGAALGEDIAYVGIETVVGVKDLTVDLFTDRSLINATMDNINEEMTDFFDSGFQLTEQVSDWVEENVTTEIALETAEGMVRDINGLISGEYAADWIKEELQEFANDPEAYVNNAIAIIEQGGTLAGEASVAVERFLNNMRNDPRAAYEIIKAISPADSIKNIIDPDKGLGERLINVPFATLDVAEMLVGFGMVNVATEAAEQGVKLGVRTAIRETAEEAGQRIGQEVAEEAGQRLTQEVAEEAGQRVGQEVAEEAGQRIGQEAVEEAGQRTTQEIAEEAGQRTTQEIAEETGQRTSQEVTEEAGQRTTQEVGEEAGQRTTQEVAEESGQRTTQEVTEETGQRATQEAAEESGQRTTQEAAEESGQRTTQEATEETTQQSVLETAEQRVENEIKNVDELPPGKKDELISAQREYDEALANAKDNTERMIDDVNSGNGISKDDVINSRGSIDTRAAQGEKIGDAGRASDIPDDFVEEYNRTLKDVQRSSYDDMIVDLKKNPKYENAELRIKEMRTPKDGLADNISQTDDIYYPGNKSPENTTIPDSINADNDFTVQIKKENGQWEEIPYEEFEDLYYKRYAQRSGYTPERAQALYPDGKWDGVTAEEKLKQIRQWGERQGEMPTSVSHREGIRDFSKESTAILNGEAPTVKIEGIDKILSPKEQAEAGIGELIDPTQLSMAENYKFAKPWSDGTVHSQSEALEQLNKAGDLLGKLENGYRDMGKVVPDMPANMQDALKVIGDRNLAPALREAKIQQLGYRNMEDFAELLTTRFEFLKLY